MKALDRLAEKVRADEELPLPLRVCLGAASVFVRAGMWVRLHGPRVRVPATVISFGNLTAGGTGKTPAVIARARAELAAGGRVAVLTRGYGSPPVREPLAVDTDVATEDLCGLLGDEPALIARKVPGIVIVKHADRVAAARAAIARHGCGVLILDDGFQHVRLERDENVLLIDASNPFGNDRIVPRGILREPLAAARRATEIVLTRCDQARDLPALIASLATLCPGIPIRKTRHAPRALRRLVDDVMLPLDAIRGMEVTAICGIGHPEAFFRTLEALGARVVGRRQYRDHTRIPADAFASETLMVTTEKDAVRLERNLANVLALCIEIVDSEEVDSG